MLPVALSLLALALSGCSIADELSADPAAPSSAAESAQASGPPAASAEPTEDAAPAAAPLEPDEVVPGCTDADAEGGGDAGEVVGEVVGGIDVDGDGARDVIRYVEGDEGARPGEACAQTLLAYAPDGIAGFVLPGDAEDPSRVEPLQPGGKGTAAYVSFRVEDPEAEGYQPHLLAYAGTAPDQRLAEVSLDGDGEPLLPYVATASTGTRAGFICSDGVLVGQVGEPRAEGGATVWSVTTTSYEVRIADGRAIAEPGEATVDGSVPDDALRVGYPALLPESSARVCS